jgi:AcrR family transcriptional regulator
MDENTPMNTTIEPGAEADGDARAVDGRVPGRRGLQTRQRLLDATERLLATVSFRDLTVVDIAREVGSSPATFYQYFRDVEEAILVLSERLVEQAASLSAPLESASWTGRAASETAERLVEAFLAFWREHEAVMRVMDLSIVEGDQRFRALRNEMLAPTSKALSGVVRMMQQEGRHPDEVDPRAQAGVLVSMLAHVAEHRQGTEAFGVAEAAAKTSMVRIVVWSITGRKPV